MIVSDGRWKASGEQKEFFCVCVNVTYYLISEVLGSNVHILLLVDFSNNLSHIYLMNKLGKQSENTM